MSVSTTPLTDPTSLPGIDYADSGALYPDWLGDVEIDGTVYRLTCCDHQIFAEEV